MLGVSFGECECAMGDGDGDPLCGNGIQETDEDCDGVDFGGEDCASLGFVDGILVCKSDCTFETLLCLPATCGDGVIEGMEQCEGDDFGTESCQTQGFDFGSLTCDAFCMVDASSCAFGYGEDFEAATYPSAFGSTGNNIWSLTTLEAGSGLQSARAGSISASQTTGTTLSLVFSDVGQLSFRYRTSSESSFDYLRFFVDSVEQASWSGEMGAWSTYNYQVTTPGVHTFEWRYTKDGSVDSNMDTALIDTIEATNASL
jgi:hypothetical protein